MGGFFLIQAFVRITVALKGLRSSLDEMSDAGLRLRDLRGELARLTETIERTKRN